MIVELQNIARISSGQGAPQGKENYSSIGKPFIKAGNLEELMISNDEYKSCQLVDEEVAKAYKLKIFPQNTIVFAKSGMSAMKARVYCLQNESYVVNHLATVIPNEEKVIPTYLKYYFKKFSPKYLIKDSAYPSIRLEDIKTIKIPLLSLEEQKHIVHILDQADSLRQKRKQAISLLDDYLKAVFLDMFGDPVTNPKGWKEIQLREGIQNIIDYRGKTPPLAESGIPLISAANIKNGNIDFSTKKFISEDTYKTWATRGFPKGNDLIITTEAPVGEVALFPKKGVYQLSRRVMALQPKELVNSKYLLYLMSTSSWRKRLFKDLRGSTVPRILKPDILKQKIILPSLKEQNRFVDLINKTKSIKQIMFSQHQQLDIQFQALLQKAFKGEPILQTATAKEEKIDWFKLKQVIGAIIRNLDSNDSLRGEMVIAKYTYLVQELFGVHIGLHKPCWLGKKFSKEHKQKISDSMKRYWKNKRENNL